jgi:hypothetical protein
LGVYGTQIRLQLVSPQVSPKGQEGLYTTLGSAPMFVAKFLVGPFSGAMLQRYCSPEAGLAADPGCNKDVCDNCSAGMEVAQPFFFHLWALFYQRKNSFCLGLRTKQSLFDSIFPVKNPFFTLCFAWPPDPKGSIGAERVQHVPAPVADVAGHWPGRDDRPAPHARVWQLPAPVAARDNARYVQKRHGFSLAILN